MLLLKKKHLLLGLCLVFIKIIPAHAADSSRLPKDRGIVLEVWGDKPLLVRPLAENVSIHPNRTYTFTHIPSFFSGWSFLSHEHKNTSHVHCRVKQGDTLYCCLWNETSPDQLGLKMPPKIVGTLQGEGFQGERTWTIYKLAVQKGHVLSLPSPDRWGTILIAPEIKIDETTNLIRKEYDLLSKQLARRNPKDLAYRRQQERLLALPFY